MSVFRLLILSALVLCGATQARAYVREFNEGVPIEWNKNRTVLMHLSLPTGGPFEDGSASFNAIAETALSIWNQNLVHMKFAVDRNSILPPADIDGNTSVLMSTTIYGEAFGKSTLAVTLVSPRANHLLEADVIFNALFDWDSYRGAAPHDGADFRRVALHEFGHVLGLEHPDQATPKQNVAAIMNSVISGIDTLQPDDINGAKSIYDSGPAFLDTNLAPNLVNLSTRAFVGRDTNTLIGGFVVQGSQPATVILRGIGYSLPAYGISDALLDPLLELHASGGAVIATSDDWTDDSWASTVASYHLDPPNSHESAILATLNPGSYTIVFTSYKDPGDPTVLSGVALVELYDLHTTAGRAGNLSSRGQVKTGNQVLIGGFIVGGNQTKEVVIRALGPSLSGAGVATPLSDPIVELRDASGSLLASNDNWGTGPNATQIQNEGLAPNNAAESALQATLNAGSYTAVVNSADGSTGIGLVEIYDLSPAPN